MEDAHSATASERMAALVALLDAAFSLWTSRRILDDQGLLRLVVHSGGPGGDRERVSARREPGEFQGVPTRFAGLDDLIAMKTAAGRPEQDLPDLRRLIKLRERRRRG